MSSILFNEFAILLGLTAAISFIAVKLRQPLILAYILVGIIAGPYLLNMISAHSQMDVLASFGITVLLFIVGLKLDTDSIKAYGLIVLMLGLGQMVLTILLSFILVMLLGMDCIPGLFVATALAFSSTIIIIKSLSDKNELDSLYGRIAIGILIIQDVVAVIAIIILSSLSVATSSSVLSDIFMFGVKGALFFGVLLLLKRKLLPYLLDQAADSRELLVLFALAFAAIVAMSSEVLGFGKEIGGFLAGVMIASSHYREAIAARLESVRNLLLVFFFINLGAALQFDTLSQTIIPAVAISLFVLVGKPFIVMCLMGYARFRKRTAFMTAITMGQVSEFSLILTAMAHQLGYIDDSVAGLIIMTSLVTICISTYMQANSNAVYASVSSFLSFVERSVHDRDDAQLLQNDAKTDVIVYGYGRHGEFLSAMLEAKNMRVLAIDFDPRKVKTKYRHFVPIRYGDAEDLEFIKTLPLHTAHWVVSTIPNFEVNKTLVAALREFGYQGKIALSAHHEYDLEPIKCLKIDLILIPYRDAALSAAEQIAQFGK